MGGGTRRRACVPHAYCTTCQATVTVSDGHCVAGHTITTPIQTSGRGRHRAPSRFDRFRKAPPDNRVPDVEEPKQPITPADPQPPEPPPQPRAPRPRPVVPQPSPASWQPVETTPRPVYTSSMLEMLGMDEDVVTQPTSGPAPAPQPVWQAPVPAQPARRVGVERLPSLSDMQTVNDHHTDTGTLIERLWVATEEHDAFRPATDLKADHLEAVPNRSFRWSIIIGAVLVLAIAVAVLQVSVRVPARIAEEATATYQAAVTDAQQVIPSARQVMAARTTSG